MSNPHRYQLYIKATPEQVWQAITDPQFTARYFHATRVDSAFTPGAPIRYTLPDGSDAVTGRIVEADPPRRLVHTWRVLYDAAMSQEPPSRVEWVIEEAGAGLTRLRVTHLDLAGSPLTWAGVKDGWVWVLDGLKTLLETGEPLPPATIVAAAVTDVSQLAGDWHRRQAVEANNSSWDLLEGDGLDAAQAEDLLRRAYAAAYHWHRATGATPVNETRALYLLARAHESARLGERALHYADACLNSCTAQSLSDFDLAYAHQARARALAVLGRRAEAEADLELARSVPVADADDLKMVRADLAVPLPEPA